MKNLYFTTFLFLLIACASDQKTGFTAVPCSKGETPEFDGQRVSLLDENGAAYKDTILGQIEKGRTVFKPCRDYIYQADFLDKNRNLITSTRIKMTASGKRWEYEPEMQDELLIQYEYSQNDKTKASQYQLNKKLLEHDWIHETKTGIIENVERIWMHPFRENQFSFTEVAPFPEVKFPLSVGKSWTSNLTIQEG